MKIHHFAISVRNIDVSINFYTNILGFKKTIPKATSPDGKYTFINLDLSGAELELIQQNDIDKENDNLNKTAKITPHIGLESFNIEKDIAALKINNVKIIDGPHTIANDVIKITILDPDGYRIDIGQLI